MFTFGADKAQAEALAARNKLAAAAAERMIDPRPDDRLLEAAPQMLEALRAVLLQHEAGMFRLPSVIEDEVRAAVAAASAPPAPSRQTPSSD